MPLLYWQLNNICPEFIPAPDYSFLQKQFNRNAARNLFLLDELCKILKLFEVHNIPAIPYKGPTLAAHVYGNLSLRQFGDLDIVIQRKDVARASEILILQGYSKQYQLTPAQEAAFLKIECEHTFTNNDGQIYIDLHWDFVPRYFSLRLDSENFWEHSESITWSNTKLMSFAPEDLLLILCINASKNIWERLIWLCDIAGLIRAYPKLKWETVTRRASQSGASRMISLSLLLAHDLLGANIPERIMSKIAADSALQRLALQVKQELFTDEIRKQARVNFLRPAKMLERFNDRIKFYLRLGLTPTMEDWTLIDLPRPLFFLYYLTRPIRLAKKYILGHRKIAS
jgi:hypothetical protein